MRTCAFRPGGRWSTAARTSPPDATVSPVLPGTGGRLHGLGAGGPVTAGGAGRDEEPAPVASSARAATRAATTTREIPERSEAGMAKPELTEPKHGPRSG